MNNPFRNRTQDYGRDQSDDWRGGDDRYRAESRRHDEERSWRGDDPSRRAYGGHDRSEAGAAGYGYGRHERDDHGFDDGRWGGGRDVRRRGLNPEGDWSGGYGRDALSAFNSGRSDFGGQGGGDYGRGSDGYASGYAPGAQIWDQARSHSDFEPDYLHWREQQMSKFDDDYRDWRAEKRQRFSSDFDTWRAGRAENAIVGDVSDGGTGDQKDIKKS